jgi:hypothetical protein
LAVSEEGGKYDNIDIVMPPPYFIPISPYPVFDVIIRGMNETIRGLFDKKLSPYSSFKDYSFAHHYSHKEWLKDIYSTMTFNHTGWTLFGLKDWWLFLLAKFQDKMKGKQIYRQTFDEMISR